MDTDGVKNYNTVVFGEVLFDCFPDGRKIPGGAPFNVAWNLQALGQRSLFVSAVGVDQMGSDLKDLAREWGMSLDGVRTIPDVRTSVVQVELEDGMPSYMIVPDTAMDYIEAPSTVDSGDGKILYHGSLAAREGKTFSALVELRDKWTGRVFLDINIRKPHFDSKRFFPMIRGVDYLKINDEELAELSGEPFELERAGELVQRFANKHQVSNVILTCGKKGAFWFQSGGDLKYEPVSDDAPVVDTVGAGDAFASVCLHGISEGWDTESILKNAAEFASRVCGNRGATTKDRDFYRLDS